jgi:predicted dehydrogenase
MIRFGTLGTAQITPSALIYPCMNEPSAVVAVIAARDRARAEIFASAHHIRTVCDSYEEVVTHPDIDAVYIPLHIPAHRHWTIKALKAGKHVLCEKSFACNAAEAAEMNVVARDTGLVAMDAFHYRYHPLFSRVKEIYDSGELGDIETISASFHIPIRGSDNIRLNYELGGGVTMDIGCYPISWIRHLTNSEPLVVSAKAEVGPPNVDVLLDSEMEIAGGIRGTTSADMREIASFAARLIVKGDRGEMLVNNPLAPQLGHSIHVSKPVLKRSSRDNNARVEVLDRRPSYAYQLDAFIQAITQGSPVFTDSKDAVKQMRIVDRCYEAAGLPLRGMDIASL